MIPYMNSTDPDNIKTVQKHAMEFIVRIFGKKNKDDPSKSIPSKFSDARIIKNHRNGECFDDAGNENGAWMFQFDEDQDPNEASKEAFDSRFKYVWVFPYGQNEEKY